MAGIFFIIGVYYYRTSKITQSRLHYEMQNDSFGGGSSSSRPSTYSRQIEMQSIQRADKLSSEVKGSGAGGYNPVSLGGDEETNKS